MIKFEESLVQQIEIIKEAASAGKLVLFIGAGVSQNSGIIGWNSLTEELRRDLTDIPIGKYSSQVIAQMYFNQFGERAYLDKIRSVLSMSNKKPNPIHDLLFDLNPSHILTTNYDQLLETCAYDNQHPYSVVNKDTALPTAEYQQRIVKVHGDFLDGGANIVLKEDDYLSYPRNYPLIKSFIESLFASSVVLFVGYGYQDDNLKQIIDQVQVYLGGKSHKAFLIKPDESNKIELDYFNKKNVQVISFQNEMLDYLKPENNPHFQDLNIDSRDLLGQGLKLFKCLNFISRFDPSTYRLSLNDIIEQCIISIESINRELPYLSSFHLRNLYPFNLMQIKWSHIDNYNYLSSANALETKNKQLIELFKAIEVDSNDKYIGLSDQYVSHIDASVSSEINKREYLEENCRKLIQLLNRHLIYLLPQSAEPSSRSLRRVLSDLPEISKDCHTLFFKFDFLESFNASRRTETDSPTNAKEQLELGYVHYQFRDYKKACIAFENASKIAWKEKQYLIYMIASFNIHRLLGSLKYFQNDSSSTEEFIRRSISKSGIKFLHKTAFNLNTSEVKKEIIRHFIENDSASSLENEVRDDLFKIRAYDSSYPEWIRLSSFKIRDYIFYIHNNCIIQDGYSNFKTFIRDAFEIYCTHYTKTIPSTNFNSFYLELAILYLDEEDLNKIFQRSRIKDIKLADNQSRDFIGKILKTLKSSYSKNSNGNISPNPYNQNEVLFGFEDRMSQMIKACIVVLSKLSIDSSDFETFKMEFLNAIHAMRVSETKWVLFVLSKHNSMFSNEEFENLILHFLNDPDFGQKPISIITHILSNRDQEYKLSNKRVISKINHLDFQTYKGNLLPIYPILEKPEKNSIKRKLSENLAEKLEIDHFRLGVLFQIVSPESGLPTYLEKILKRTRLVEDQTKEPFKFNQNRESFLHFKFIIESLIEGYKVVNVRSKEIKELRKVSNLFNWLLYPKRFDYQDFDKMWLKFDRSDWFIQRISEIDPLRNKLKEIIGLDEDYDLAYFYSQFL